MGTLTNSEDPDEMQHNAAFHQGLHYLLRQKSMRKKIQFFFGNDKLGIYDTSILIMPHLKMIVSN